MHSFAATNKAVNGIRMEQTAMYNTARFSGLLKSTTTPGGGIIAGILLRSIIEGFVAGVTMMGLDCTILYRKRRNGWKKIQLVILAE
jgi:hypothetical protein